MIYIKCFKNPFTEDQELHFTSLLYPHLQFHPMPISETKALKPQPILDSQ